MNSQLAEIQEILNSNRDSTVREFTSKIVPGSQKVYGVKMPVLNTIAKDHKAGGFELVEELWSSGSYEEQILTAKILELIAKKDPARALKLVKKYSAEIDNWAVCDAFGMQSLKSIVKTHSDEIFALATALNKMPGVWQKRLSLFLVEWYTRDPAKIPAIEKLMKPLRNEKEHYIRKAIQWLDRNVAKRK